MIRLGVVLALFGFGSALLHFTSVQFTLLMWAEPMQPALGLVLGGAGVVVLVLKIILTKEEPAQDTAQQNFGPPPGGYAPPPDVQRPQGQPAFQPQFQPQAGPQQSGPPLIPQAPAEPVLGRPQFAPHTAGMPRPVPQAPHPGVPQFPPAPQQFGPGPQQPFGPQGGAPLDPRG